MSTIGKRRALGQHFLRDAGIAARIAQEGVALAREHRCGRLLEIGPGRGAITMPLLEELAVDPGKVREMVLAERDRELVELWKSSEPMGERSSAVPVRVEAGDFLELPEERWLPAAGEPPLAVVSNLPYSAGTAIATRLAAHPGRIPFMVLMFQAEVARRMRAEPGTKDWGSLSVWVQNHWDVTRLVHVPPGAFRPPPKVDSEVVTFRARAEARIPLATPDHARLWQELLRHAFAHRRKMLRAGLPPGGPWRKALQDSGVDPTLRAEALSWEQWSQFFAALVAIR